MDNDYDLRLVKRISEKDTNALSEFYDIHSKYLFTIIFFIVKDEAEAEDLLQEVFLQIWTKINFYDESIGNPMAWVIRITRNKCIDKLRSKEFKKRLSETIVEKLNEISDTVTLNPENNFDINQQQIQIKDSLNSMTKNQKDLIEYAYYRGYTQSQLAEYFDIPLGTAKTRMRSAKILLKNKLQYFI